MKLNESGINLLLSLMPAIQEDYPLEWDGEEGHAKIEDHEIKCGPFTLYVNFEINEMGVYDPGDHFREPSFSSMGRDYFNFEIDVHSHDIYVYDLTPWQHNQIEKSIINKFNQS